MASAKLLQLMEDEGEDAKMDMSPMIDIVFLLLLFFIIASKIIKIQQDPKVKPPIAENSQPQKIILGRIVINVYEDGTFHNAGGTAIELSDITDMARRTKEEYEGSKVTAKLHLRAHRNAPVLAVKKATKAAGDGGVINVIFSSLKSTVGRE